MHCILEAYERIVFVCVSCLSDLSLAVCCQKGETLQMYEKKQQTTKRIMKNNNKWYIDVDDEYENGRNAGAVEGKGIYIYVFKNLYVQ